MNMRPYVPVVNTVLCELRQRLDGENIENTLYFNKSTEWDSESMMNMGGALADWWTTAVMVQLSGAITLNEVAVTDLTTQTSGVASVTAALPVPGSINLESVPSNVAACISFHTANRGKAYRGRNYIAGLPDNAVSTNTITTGVAGILQAAYNDLIDVATAQGAVWVVVSRFQGTYLDNGKKKPLERTVGLSTPITNAAFGDLTVDSQRGRLPNH